MGSSRGRLTLGRMMAVVGVVALILGLRRVDSAPAVSFCVFAACTWYLASRRFAESMARRSAQGLTTSRAHRARILLGAASIAVVAIGLPDAAFLAGYYGFMEAIRATTLDARWSPEFDPWHMTMGAVIGITAALSVATIVRRWIGPILGAKPVVWSTASREPSRPRPEQPRVPTVDWPASPDHRRAFRSVRAG